MDFVSITMAGHVVADPVVREGKDDRKFVTFSIAVNQHYSGQDYVSYYDCIAPEYMYQGMQKAGLAKGSAVSVTGMQTVRTYNNSSTGRDATSVSVRVLDWRFVGSRAKSSGQQTGYSAPAEQAPGYGSVQPPVNLQDEDDLPL